MEECKMEKREKIIITIFILINIFLINNSFVNGLIPEKILIYIPFDEISGSTVYDLSANGMNGEVFGNITITNGILNNARECYNDNNNPNNYINFGDFNYIPQGNYTIRFWLKPNLTTNSVDYYFFKQTDTGTTPIAFYMNKNTQNMAFAVNYNDSSYYMDWLGEYNYGSLFDDNNFHMITGTVNNDFGQIYIDDVNVFNETLNRIYPSNFIGNFTMFNNPTGGIDESGYGIMDEFLIYNDSYTQSDINFDYNNGSPQSPFNIPPSKINVTINCSKNYIIGDNDTIIINWSNATGTKPINYTLYYSDIYNITDGILYNGFNLGFEWINWNNYLYNDNWYFIVKTSNIYGFNNSYSCSFNVCKNDWVRTIQPCISDTKLISYYDKNNCNKTYNFPIDNGTYTNCITKTITEITFDKSIIIPIVFVILIVVFIVLGIFIPLSFGLTIAGILSMLFAFIGKQYSPQGMETILFWIFIGIGISLITIGVLYAGKHASE
jgi:hypothetical protein